MAEQEQGPPHDEPSVEDLIQGIRELDVSQLLFSTVTTLASLTYAKLDAGALDQARIGIEAIGALVPVLEGSLEPATTRDLRAALANLQLAFVERQSSASAGETAASDAG